MTAQRFLHRESLQWDPSCSVSNDIDVLPLLVLNVVLFDHVHTVVCDLATDRKFGQRGHLLEILDISYIVLKLDAARLRPRDNGLYKKISNGNYALKAEKNK